ncbi:MAG: phytanoyl-CoA dioxygenase family protein [Caldilineaceae bacterium SB0662_bin_9]|uniref:Phytanoyl-CoA dioxygenase family protein n=1 Tax=Caldilineaceae bacterium SB0662_bin_9 TaxID=2605258 RepID=A0A6B1DVK1_9CHLR|nr:phytanoyl-CoA dioxygenase family protein [Caldilineaceae bacterium]MYD91027.1 phytanoyl-CoA dioxygenase family protein [Caldilineaceae bacterium SB0662_bin_9]
MAEFAYPNLDGLDKAYARDGFAIVRQVIDESLVAEANRHVDWLIKHNPDLPPERLGYWLTPTDPFWMRLVSDPRLVDVAAAVVGPDVALFAADYIAKPPGTGQRVAWHQDASYWPLEPMQVVTLWVAYTESNRANGCVRVIPGTQHMSLQPRNPDETDYQGEMLRGMDQSLISEDDAVDFILEPGDVSLHHPMIIHGSEANSSSRWRRGGTYQYIPTTTEVTKKDWPVFLLRGTDTVGRNTYRELPRYVPGQHMRFRGCEAWT